MCISICVTAQMCMPVSVFVQGSGPPRRVLLHINPSINQLLLTHAVWLHTGREGRGSGCGIAMSDMITIRLTSQMEVSALIWMCLMGLNTAY